MTRSATARQARGAISQATNDVGAFAPLFADLLSIPTDQHYPTLILTPQKRKEKTLQALVSQAEGLALRYPVLMIFEDLHWSDPTTRELLDLLVERVPKVRLLVLITYRPEFSPTWVGHPDVTPMTLVGCRLGRGGNDSRMMAAKHCLARSRTRSSSELTVFRCSSKSD